MKKTNPKCINPLTGKIRQDSAYYKNKHRGQTKGAFGGKRKELRK